MGFSKSRYSFFKNIFFFDEFTCLASYDTFKYFWNYRENWYWSIVTVRLRVYYFGIGVTLAIFCWSGKFPCCMLVFMISASGDAIISDTNFNMEVSILSRPVEQSSLNDLISLSTSSYVTQLSLKLFSDELISFFNHIKKFILLCSIFSS